MLVLGILMFDGQRRCKERTTNKAEERKKVIGAGVSCGRDPVSRNRRLFACIDHDVERVRVRMKRHLGFKARGRSRVP